MPRATKPKPLSRNDVSRLTQAAAAKLIGKPAVWLRDHPELANRNEDGTYDGPALVRAVIKSTTGQRDSKDLKVAAIEAQTRRDNATAARTEQRIAIESANLIERGEVRMAINAIQSAATERLLGLADKVSGDIPAEVRGQVIAVIRQDVGKVLAALRDDLAQKVVPPAFDE